MAEKASGGFSEPDVKYESFEDYVDELIGKVKPGDAKIKFYKEHARFRDVYAFVSEEISKRFDGLWYEQNRPTIEKIIEFSVAFTRYCEKRKI